MSNKKTPNNNLIAWYPFNDSSAIGKDLSGNNHTAKACGTKIPQIEEVKGRKAVHLFGGEHGVSYLELPSDILSNVSDSNGLTVSAWVCADKGTNVWERILDFGKNAGGPYIFLTRALRGVCFCSGDIAADAMKQCPVGEWQHIAMTITGTKGGTLSSAGPRVYINGELVADGFISQTSSGAYGTYRTWLSTLDDSSNYVNNYIGHSQFPADADFCGSISDFRLYSDALSENEIIGLMCESLSDEQILELAKNKFLEGPSQIITDNLTLANDLMDGKVKILWSCDKPSIIAPDGTVTAAKVPVGVTITATLTCGKSSLTKTYTASVLPKNLPPYEITIHGDKESIDISKTLYGLFYEDINNAADGGIYAEMINNRSFEAFTFDTYNFRSGEHGKSTGRNHFPLKFWFGDTDKVIPKNHDGLNKHLGIKDKDTNSYYLDINEKATLYNRGFCDNNHKHSMNFKAGVGYSFTIWAKASKGATLKIALLDANDTLISNEVMLAFNKTGTWNKYKAPKLIANSSCLGQIKLEFTGNASIDMVSLMPDDVWGAKKEKSSPSAHNNFKGNPNYRLRKDLVETLIELHPTFLRFPGGCISEGSYIWENVYDWKESVGVVEVRKENFNVWGYNMTMGLGYMEYFQLAEDLGAEPLPVMACGVLCQARSDYANPAGGKLQKKYIKNFTDLIDFAISTDFDNNKWAALRKEMGHEAPFGLHYLGVGNENWGTEFFASFEIFKTAIDKYMKKNYPGYPLTIISTVGAQADDVAYQQGWKFLAGYLKGGATVTFTDGENGYTKDVTWYTKNKNYMDTIADEHYYRSNEYLLENADRYNYYYREYKKGILNDSGTSKVFVGEYASTDKNTLAGAIAEAAVMTGFEKNSDVVRLAATAPLFNKIVSDGTYRWTPDAIWFDNEAVWRTPNYYVQQMFAKYIGKKLLKTSYSTYDQGVKKLLTPHGGVVILAEGTSEFKHLTIKSGRKILFEQDFNAQLQDDIIPITTDSKKGFFINRPDWCNYTVDVTVSKNSDSDGIYVGVGLDITNPEKPSLLEYCVGTDHGTGLKVYKNGVEAYTLGDYSSSVFAGNLRACYAEEVKGGTDYNITVNYGDKNSELITCFYHDSAVKAKKEGLLECKLEAYNRDIYHSVTQDETHVYTKLVNADNFSKEVLLKLDSLNVKENAKLVVLTADKELVNKPNVNTKNSELVVPLTKKLSVKKNSLKLLLPANSVTVLVLDREA